MTPEESQEHRLTFLKGTTEYLERDHSNVVSILKAHLFTEQMLNAILMSNLKIRESQLDTARFNFVQKVSLVIAQECLSNKVEKALLALNKIRNKCAHRFEFEVTDEHWEEIYSPFVEDMPYEETVPKSEDQKWLRWCGWLLGLLFPTADVYKQES